MLTVKQLIEQLQTMPADSVIYVNGCSDFMAWNAPMTKRVDIIAEFEEIDPVEYNDFFSSIADDSDWLDSCFINKVR